MRERFALAQGSVTGLPFADDTFDCVVSMRLLHHFGEIEKRRQALSELARISRRYVVVSPWTDGNYKAWRRQRMETGRAGHERQNRHIASRSNLAADFAAAGLTAVRHFDLIPLYSQWRYYVLERVDA